MNFELIYNLFDKYIKNNNLEYNLKMEVVSHNLLVSLVENDFGIGLATKEFIKNKLDNNLFEIKVKHNIPKRSLGYVIKSDIYPSFAVKKFIEIIKSNLID